ncbi:MAG: asparagine synthase (glutamine-hydrolyzing) [Burkholderiaceae bacterium]
MCGLVGYLGPVSPDLLPRIELAAHAIRHRGPDDHGLWQDADAGVVLAHRRLSVIDTSMAGHQPMRSACGRFVIAYNGEIYNHLELREALGSEDRNVPAQPMAQAAAWRGSSDTETLLACFSRWGVERSLTRAVGMFALALWDREKRTLTLARDRIGEKPLYFGWAGRGFGFASELKALRMLPGFDDRISTTALAAYMARASGAVPAPSSIYESARKLMPGTTLVLSPADVERRVLPDPVAYWSLQKVIDDARADPIRSGDEESVVDALEATLGEAVRSQMIADVPLGAFLSGGVDSSLVVALMQRRAGRPISTFSIGFEDPRFDESGHARAVARHLGTEHHELIVDDRAARDVIPRLPSIYCEPFADPSQIPTAIVSELARRRVTVCLSGDGGDELFGGYSRYTEMERLWQRRSTLPTWLRRLGSAGIDWIGAERLAALARPVARHLPARQAARLDPALLAKMSALLAEDDIHAFYDFALASYWPAGFVRGGRGAARRPARPSSGCRLTTMMANDQLGYLPDTILAKVDRAAMAFGLETRVPMLDVRVIEFAWRLPPEALFSEAGGKRILWRLLDRHVPAALTRRPKQGFGVPIDAWLRGPLRDWAQALIDPIRLRDQGLFDVGVVQRRWRDHLAGSQNWQFDLWTLLMFQAWFDESRRLSGHGSEPRHVVPAPPAGRQGQDSALA